MTMPTDMIVQTIIQFNDLVFNSSENIQALVMLRCVPFV